MAKSGQHGGNVLQMAEKHGLHPDQVIDFSANINPAGMPDKLRQQIIDNLSCLEQYPDIEYTQLHEAIARHHDCSANTVLAGNGATELIFLWAHYVQPKKALLVEPGFAEYRRALLRTECTIADFILREEEGFQITERLLSALTPDLDCLFLCTPNNPTGLIPDQHLLSEIIERCHHLNIRLFIDESFLDFTPEYQSATRYLKQYPNLYILRSLTKFYALPGLRLGYLLSSDEQLLETIREQREPWTINALAALAGETLFDDTQYHQTTYAWLNSEQDYLFTALSRFSSLKCFAPTANYLFFKHLRKNSDLQFQLMQQGILIRSCANYTGLDKRFYRVAIKSREDNQKLVRTLEQVLRHD
ncbi:threonine-phosphate decarboxylase [Vibrio albus]|uniref:threonine-phosphate decarboxylase n=1 Tax=Vibrio albus TaxID=2200953 RepID=A0A2U3B629_9VIBR|nr:threonine-phosphate decarboxylase CobD [Vibrio albus]PWI32256.1 threonine-phosphate decarboxylase [Vibrio albus]